MEPLRALALFLALRYTPEQVPLGVPMQRSQKHEQKTEKNAEPENAPAKAGLGNAGMQERLGLGQEQTPVRLVDIPGAMQILQRLWHHKDLGGTGENSAHRAAPKTGKSSKAPKEMTGIGSKVAVGRFTEAARKVEGEWPKLKPVERANRLGKAANEELKQVKVPDTAQSLEDLGADSGQFDFTTWTLSLGKEPFSEKTVTTSEAADIADTVYHETRHAEQWHRLARYRAGQGKDASELASELEIPKRIAEDAAKQPLSGNSQEAKEGGAWYDSVYGKKSEHRETVLTNLDRFGKDLEKAEARYDKVRADPKATTKQKTAALADWKDAKKKFDKVYKQYRSLPEEADAWKVGGAVTAAFSPS